MVYARIASGYRPGGPESYIAGAPASLPREYGSDSTVNYEVGTKATFFDHMLTVDAALFYIDWTNVQINVAVPVNQGQANGVAYTVVENAGKAVSQGVEWSIVLTPVSGFSLGTLGSYDDARLSQNAPGIGGLSGDRLPYVPEWTYSFTANYEHPISQAVTGYAAISYSHVGDRYNGYALTPSISHLEFPGYNTVLADAGLRKGRFGLELYGKNLTNTRGITYYYGGQGALGGVIPGQVGLIRPREIGLRFTGSF
jgi:outer membrane receptor protein involved in Fe transport